ncbi:hypothetical protein HEK616_32490 [Streptomyces nigrescens]|uniref:HEAT repeat domain-containing protein n=2 Tax=Streptomyces TaxID=1883 RepID=A0ABM7ZTQ6_STRNI|nr:hypothetical protein [Streptomyces nigrescens]MEE4417909.1 hypothetical protein [Streptomyces sp. DSM 41528]BDM69762.1 hypothetical protein HEK616_32490 [Streptomyces nigrescens]
MTDRIDQLLASKDEADPSLLAALDADDLADALGRALAADDENRVRALGILSLIDPSPLGALAQAVGQVLAEPAPDPFTVAAALDRAAVMGQDAVPLAQAAAVSDEPVIALAAWRTLQQVARSDSLDALAQMAPPAGDPVGDQAAFALSVIAYRAGRSGFELTPADDSRIVAIPANEDKVFFINTSAPTEEDFALLSRMPAGELYLVRPEREGMLAIECGDERMLLCIDSDIQMGMPDTFLQGPSLAGVVTTLAPLGTDYSVRYLVLTWPDGTGGFHVMLCQPNGAEAYFGHANSDEIANGTATFGLFAIDRPGACPISLTPSVTAGGVTLGGDCLSMTEIVTDRLEPEAAD